MSSQGTTAFEAVSYDVEESVATIRLDRPSALNAQSTRLLVDLEEALNLAKRDEDVAVIALLGNGSSFSAGHDLAGAPDADAEIQRLDARRRDGTTEGLWEYERKIFYDYYFSIQDCPKPVIAGVHGHLAVAGVMLAAACDLIIAADDAKFQDHSVGVYALAMPEVGWHPWELGVRKAKEFLWTGGIWDAETMEKVGLVNRVVPRSELEGTTIEWARQVARLPRFALLASKMSLNQAADLMGRRAHQEYHWVIHELTHTSSEAKEYASIRASVPHRQWLRTLRQRAGFPDPMHGTNHEPVEGLAK